MKKILFFAWPTTKHTTKGSFVRVKNSAEVVAYTYAYEFTLFLGRVQTTPRMTGHSRPYNKAINITLENAAAAGLLLSFTFYRITIKETRITVKTLAKTDLLLLFPLKALRLLYVLTSFFLFQ